MTKKIFILVLILPSLSFSQVTHHFPHQNATWGQFIGSSLSGVTGSTIFHIADGDTVVEGIVYTKILYVDSIWIWQSHLAGLIREDSLGDVYSRYFDGGTDTLEHLLYKFNVAPGDTFNVFNNIGNVFNYVTVDSVSEITDSYGLERKAIYISPSIENGCNTLDPLIWIEGIGSNAGLFTPKGNWIADGLAWLTCFSENDSVKLYECAVCNLWLGMNSPDESFRDGSFKIYPNPATEIVNVELQQSLLERDVKIIISDMSGRQLQINSVNSKSTLDIRNLHAGVYLISLSSEDKSGLKLLIKSN